MQGKVCPKCKRLKEKPMFNRSTSRIDKMAVYCKECENIYKKKKTEERKQDAMYGII